MNEEIKTQVNQLCESTCDELDSWIQERLVSLRSSCDLTITINVLIDVLSAGLTKVAAMMIFDQENQEELKKLVFEGAAKMLESHLRFLKEEKENKESD